MKNLALILGCIVVLAGFFTAGFLTGDMRYTEPRSYQIQIQDTTALLYDHNNLIGRFKLEGELDSLITKDNE